MTLSSNYFVMAVIRSLSDAINNERMGRRKKLDFDFFLFIMCCDFIVVTAILLTLLTKVRREMDCGKVREIKKRVVCINQ